MIQVFLNYRADDEPFGVSMLDQELSHRFGSAAVFLASKSILLGSDWEPRMLAAVAESTAVLVVMGREWLSAKNRKRLDNPADLVRREIRHALELDKQVIPVRLGITRPSKEEFPEVLAELHGKQDIEVRFRSSRVDVDLLATKLAELIPALRDTTEGHAKGAPSGRVVRNCSVGQLWQGDFTISGDFYAGPPIPPNGKVRR